MNIVLYKKPFRERLVMVRALAFMTFSMMFSGQAWLIVDDKHLAKNGKELLSGEKAIGVFPGKK
ncbi:hypothetical protein M0245_004533 [Salmonella enterica]|nr:hypothetical protein [Salmonella enterica]